MKGSSEPGNSNTARVSVKFLYEIAKIKQEIDPDLKTHDVEGVFRMVLGTTRSMGFDVVEDTFPPAPIKIDP